MPITAIAAQRIAIGEHAALDAAGMRRLQGASPILLGLIAPLILVYLLDPAALRQVRFLIAVMLVIMLVVASALYIASVLTSGNVRTIVIDRQQGIVEFFVERAFADALVKVPFSEIASVRRTKVGGRDEYGESCAVVELRNKQFIELPEGVTDADIETILSALGRVPRASA